MPPSPHGSSTCGRSLACQAYRLAGGVVPLPNPVGRFFAANRRVRIAASQSRPAPSLRCTCVTIVIIWGSPHTSRVLLVSLHYLIRPRQEQGREREAEHLRCARRSFETYRCPVMSLRILARSNTRDSMTFLIAEPPSHRAIDHQRAARLSSGHDNELRSLDMTTTPFRGHSESAAPPPAFRLQLFREVLAVKTAS
jgi:hypothetical protein